MQNAAFIPIITSLIGGLILFLYSIRRLSTIMKGIFTVHSKKIIERFTNNVFSGVIIGTLITILLDSSSAVIIITIVFINSGTLNFKQAMGIIMGANIGTTFSSQLIALNISFYAVVPLVIGFIIWFFSKSTRNQQIGKILLYFGMLFFGLFILENSVAPLKNSEQFNYWISKINNPVKGVAIGGLITLIIQSSSATVAMLITLAKQHLIEISTAMAMMLGAELGTCSDTLLAVIGGKRDAIRAGVFHLIFNFIPIIIGLLFFDYFENLVVQFSSSVHSQIANAHVLFSLISVLLFLPFINLIFKFIHWIIPNKK